MCAKLLVFAYLASLPAARRLTSTFDTADADESEAREEVKSLARSLWSWNIPAHLSRATRALPYFRLREPQGSPRADIGTFTRDQASRTRPVSQIEGLNQQLHDHKPKTHDAHGQKHAQHAASSDEHLSILSGDASSHSNAASEGAYYQKFSELDNATSSAIAYQVNKTMSEGSRVIGGKRLALGAIVGLLATLGAPFLPRIASAYSHFALASPYMCSIYTSSAKGVISDIIAQLVVEGKKRPCIRRVSAFTIFGAFYLGAYCQWKYAFLYTALFGAAKTAPAIAMKVAVDMLISAPFVYFPSYYLFKGALFGKPLREVRSYFTKDGFSMLKRYWAVWVPTTLVMWTAVPVHLRVPFLCAVSLAWQVLLSTRSYAKKPKREQPPPLPKSNVSLIVDR